MSNNSVFKLTFFEKIARGPGKGKKSKKITDFI